jgi:hypothetical protein
MIDGLGESVGEYRGRTIKLPKLSAVDSERVGVVRINFQESCGFSFLSFVILIMIE